MEELLSSSSMRQLFTGGVVLSHVLFLLLLFMHAASPGANDLHFHDGSSTVDVIAGDIFFEILEPPELQYSYRVRPAKDFGAPFNESVELKGVRLVPTVPLDACSEVLNPDDVLGQVAFVERGECSFVLKSRQAELAGARAVIITETLDLWDHSLDHLIEMVDDKMDYEVQIPSAFLLGKSGATILRTLRQQRRRYALINLPVNMTYVSIGKMNQPPWIGWPEHPLNDTEIDVLLHGWNVSEDEYDSDDSVEDADYVSDFGEEIEITHGSDAEDVQEEQDNRENHDQALEQHRLPTPGPSTSSATFSQSPRSNDVSQAEGRSVPTTSAQPNLRRRNLIWNKDNLVLTSEQIQLLGDTSLPP